MEVSVLGPVAVALDGAPVDLGTPKQRSLVAALALSRGRAVSVDAIVDLLWGDAPPGAVGATLQGYVSQLRRVLEPDRPRRAPATVLVTVAPGYALRTAADSLDVARFERAVEDAHRLLAGGDATAAQLEETAGSLDEALALWRGTPYAELGDADAAVAERARLEELRLVAQEDRAAVGLALGQHATVVAELEALTAAHPLRERLWGLRALALVRTGRQADALDVLRQVREVLADELGLEPTAELRELQTAVLRQDPGLDWVPPERAAVAAPTPAPAPAAPEPEEQVAPWPMAGRDADLAALTGLLDRAATGVPAYAVLTGEPGIGKSRLAAELVVRARRGGTRVLVGRCSQDDGAPPLWPWKSVLDGLGADLLDDGPSDEGEGGQFRAWERIARTVRAAAVEQPTLVVLDDLHWADSSTLRVLRLLVETTDQAPLMVLVTWRAHPEPAGELAAAAEALARMHALRLHLEGLPAGDVAAVFEGVTSRGLDAPEAEALRARTDGNPFFLVELARLAGARTTPGDELPTAVSDVLNRRLLRLPEGTVTALRAAAVIGRQFDTPTLATVTGIVEDDLVDVVEPAQAAGLVREDGIDHYRFAHALVRDTLRSGMSASRRARAHARVAEALTGQPGRETEVARHWREAGPSYGDRAWRSAVEAATLARRFYAYDEAAELLEGALVSLETDAQATLRDRYDVLMALMEAYRWAAQLPDLVATVEQAIEIGKRLDDPEAVARAAMSTTEGVLWRSGAPGSINEEVVDALRSGLDRLPPEDSELRCRTMLALANELYDTVGWAERRALTDEGLAMARRLDDPRLLMHACQAVFVSLWHVRTAAERLVLAREALDLAHRTRSDRAVVVCSTLLAAALSELGRTDEMWPAVDAARAAAQEQRILFGELVLGGLEIPWRAMAGRFDECERLLEHLQHLGRQMSHSNVDETLAAALLAVRLWQGRPGEMVPVLEAFDESAYPFAASIAVYLWRAGEPGRARAVYAERGAPLDHDNDISLLAWAHAAELALYLGEPALAADAYARLAPFAGLSTCAGSTLALGPVDSYLALAAAATGERDLAARHADDALALAGAWDVPLVAEWLRTLRAEHGF
ncbi:AAA family ATPase [Nocardioides sp. CGMCC 1.13656]|uniref:BTAD domain-containing putative transcriptional regulator n=1 Tax=Nocardioides TaxID=1839 RepID=UPI0015ECB549|nr:BTAD domain-containing putative transcriptional regulator [Nocardioides sp. CGMCC 1.13656]MBA2956601.1 AAA family ATPase [Nocardioides sp. CGMCC 1.13656]